MGDLDKSQLGRIFFKNVKNFERHELDKDTKLDAYTFNGEKDKKFNYVIINGTIRNVFFNSEEYPLNKKIYSFRSMVNKNAMVFSKELESTDNEQITARDKLYRKAGFFRRPGDPKSGPVDGLTRFYLTAIKRQPNDYIERNNRFVDYKAENDLKKLRVDYNELEKQKKAQLIKANEDLAKSQQRIDNIKINYNDLERTCKELNAKYDENLTNSGNIIRDKQVQIEKAEEELALFREEADTRSTELKTLKAQYNTVFETNSRNEEKIKELKQDYEDKQDQLKFAEANIVKNKDDYDIQITKAQNNLEQAEKELDDCRSNTGALEQKNIEAADKIKACEANLKKSSQLVQTKEAQLEKAKNDLKDLTQKHNDNLITLTLQRASEKQRLPRSELLKRIQEKREKIKKLQLENQTLKKLDGPSITDFVKLKSENEELKFLLEQSKQPSGDNMIVTSSGWSSRAAVVAIASFIVIILKAFLEFTSTIDSKKAISGEEVTTALAVFENSGDVSIQDFSRIVSTLQAESLSVDETANFVIGIPQYSVELMNRRELALSDSYNRSDFNEMISLLSVSGLNAKQITETIAWMALFAVPETAITKIITWVKKYFPFLPGVMAKIGHRVGSRPRIEDLDSELSPHYRIFLHAKNVYDYYAYDPKLQKKKMEDLSVMIFFAYITFLKANIGKLKGQSTLSSYFF